MIRFEDLVQKAQTYMPDSDIELLRRAYVFSALAHRGQVRQSGQPYLVHPLEVAYFLADLRLDPAAIIAGLLHDVVEDTLTTVERLEELFGKEVAHLVELGKSLNCTCASVAGEDRVMDVNSILIGIKHRFCDARDFYPICLQTLHSDLWALFENGWTVPDVKQE